MSGRKRRSNVGRLVQDPRECFSGIELTRPREETPSKKRERKMEQEQIRESSGNDSGIVEKIPRKKRKSLDHPSIFWGQACPYSLPIRFHYVYLGRRVPAQIRFPEATHLLTSPHDRKAHNSLGMFP